MQEYLQYLDLPKVPDELIESLETIRIKPRHTPPPIHYDEFQPRLVQPNLIEWAKSVFKRDCWVQYQIIKNGIMIHKDRDINVKFNYLLQTGGNDVRTCFYDENIKLVFSERIPAFTWHRMRTDVFHDVKNLTEDRIAISVIIKDYIWGDSI